MAMARIVLIGVISSTIYNARVGKTGHNVNVLNRPHGFTDSYEKSTKLTPEEQNLNALEFKCKKFGVYKTMEGILATVASGFLLNWLNEVLNRKLPNNLSDFTILFWEMSDQVQLLYVSCIMGFSLLSLISGMTGFIGAVKVIQIQKRTNFLGTSLILQITCELLSPVLFIPSLYFVGLNHKRLIVLFFLIYFPYNIYIIYIFRQYLRKFKFVKSGNPYKADAALVLLE